MDLTNSSIRNEQSVIKYASSLQSRWKHKRNFQRGNIHYMVVLCECNISFPLTIWLNNNSRYVLSTHTTENWSLFSCLETITDLISHWQSCNRLTIHDTIPCLLYSLFSWFLANGFPFLAEFGYFRDLFCY